MEKCDTHDSMTIIVIKLYFTPRRRPSWIGGYTTHFHIFQSVDKLRGKVDLFAHLKNTLPKGFKLSRSFANILSVFLLNDGIIIGLTILSIYSRS